ncbi:hypothetical protein TNCV_3574421 [Trichonephila clavipes]|nr:hypothetical protein TNCV_3574421 [Trichonephila clavipes]
MGQYDDGKCTLTMCCFHDGAKDGCGHIDALNRTWIHLDNIVGVTIGACVAGCAERLIICICTAPSSCPFKFHVCSLFPYKQ